MPTLVSFVMMSSTSVTLIPARMVVVAMYVSTLSATCRLLQYLIYCRISLVASHVTVSLAGMGTPVKWTLTSVAVIHVLTWLPAM